VALRLYTIGDKSLWLDESFSLWMIRQPFGDFWRYVNELDLHPPLYYVLLRGWAVLGESEEWLRAFSALWSVLTVPVVYAIGKVVGGRWLGLLAAGILAISPLHIEYAHQTRMYSMATFFAAAAVLCLLRLLDQEPAAGWPTPDPSPQARPWSLHAVGTPWWLGFVATTWLTMLSHNVAVFLPVSFGLFVLVAAALSRRNHPALTGRLRTVATGLSAAVLLWLPWAPNFVEHAARVDEEFWIQSPTVDTALRHWRDLGSAAGADAPYALPLALAFLALAWLGAWRLRTRPLLLALLVLVVLVPYVGEHLVSIRRPIFYTRTIIWSTPPFYVLLAAGLLQLRFRALIAAGTAALVALNIVSLLTFYRYEGQENWRAAASYVASRAQPGDVLLFTAGWTQLPFDYYYERTEGPPLPEHGVPATLFDRGILEPIMTRADVPRLDGLIAGQPRVWLLYSHSGYSDPQGIVPAHLDEVLVEVDEQAFTGVTVQLYQQRAS
jgi:mannosyltransferase